MSTLRHRVAIPVAIVLALAVTPTLTGCFGNPVQNIVKAATGGKVNIGGTTVPSDFPKSVPVLSGKVITATAIGSGTKEIWNVTIQTDSDPTSGIESALKNAGFTIDSNTTTTTDKGGLIAAETKDWVVAIVVAKTDTKYAVNYSVSSASNTK